MANITLGALRDLWKTVSDWVSGTSADIPKVSDDDVKTALDILNSKDFATQTTLATMLNKIIAAPATEAKQDALKAVVDTLGTEATLAAIKSWIDGTDDVSAPKVTLSGTMPELLSAQYAESTGTVRSYISDGSNIEVYVEVGYIRVRTDGQPCTAVTGEPLGEGFGAAWSASDISVLYMSDAVITVVVRQ